MQITSSLFHVYYKLLAIWVMIFCLATSAHANPLETGKALASTRYRDWTYGSNAATKIDCVQFVLAVVEEELQTTLGDEIRRAILINYGWDANETQRHAATGSDVRLAGVQYGLVDLARRGTKIAPSQAEVGDFIQYWMKKSDGTWFGHCGIVSSVSGSRVGIFGAHLSQNKIADSTFQLDLAGADRLIYIVRLNRN